MVDFKHFNTLTSKEEDEPSKLQKMVVIGCRIGLVLAIIHFVIITSALY